MWMGKGRLHNQLKDKFEFPREPKPTDLVIAVIGRTGVGKSTFINILFGDEVAPVGRTLESATSKVQYYEYPHSQHADRRILVVDTPGFDDHGITEGEILRRIAVWLAKSYQAKMQLAGLIYMFDINTSRFNSAEAKSYEIFEALCGKDWAKKVVFATSKWDKLSDVKEGEYSEKQLKENFWQDMYSRGSTIHRLGCSRELAEGSAGQPPEDSKESAQKVINSILSRDFTGYVTIQKELADQKKDLTETEAGKIAVEKKKRIYRFFNFMFR